MNKAEALGLARYLVNTGIPIDEAIRNPAIPPVFNDEILQILKDEQNIILEPANLLTDDEEHVDWLNAEDRSNWYYWPTLRQYLLTQKGWPGPSVQSLDKETDRILERLASPKSSSAFDKKGLVLGFVQSGKTANYTALISKAADAGYRLIIVLSGIDNGLRLQTHRRLKKELIGGTEKSGVRLPPIGKRWHEFTRDDLNGDFQSGYVNTAALQGSEPVLLVIKKNGAVLRRLLGWLESAPEDIKRTLPLLVIDDESDLASIDTKGSYQSEDEEISSDYEPPTVINGLIRDLLSKFNHKAYVAYTATPFANILIPHDNYDPRVSDDLYPRNFIVNLPKPKNYFGAEELFGRMNDSSDEEEGIDVIRPVVDVNSDDYFLERKILPPSMENAILSFVLAGAARAYRLRKDFSATMLIHISLRIIDQLQLSEIVDKKFSEFKDEWRYYRKDKIYNRMLQLWEEDFLPIIEIKHPDKVIRFEDLEPNISTFFESVQIRTLNSASGDILDYENEPYLKAIAIGGNKLSRGLTLEGLLVSFFTRRTRQYDTLMQMGRWFGFREDYEDLTRIYTTSELAQWFTDLATVEYQLREDIRVYEELQRTPLEVGMRIKAHPVMQVTSPSKRRFATEKLISKSYDMKGPQTINFKFDNLEILSEREEKNLAVVKEFLAKLGKYNLEKKGPVWQKISADKIIDFLEKFIVDETSLILNIPLVVDYIKNLNENGELVNWTVAICGLENVDPNLGEVDWGLTDVKINQINRSRIRSQNTLKEIESQGDETIDLSDEEMEKWRDAVEKKGYTKNLAARNVRSASKGLILLYPISKNSMTKSRNRIPIYEDPDDPLAKNLIGMAISFPKSNVEIQPTEKYITGTVPWGSADGI